jgi:hypothetical protein
MADDCYIAKTFSLYAAFKPSKPLNSAPGQIIKVCIGRQPGAQIILGMRGGPAKSAVSGANSIEALIAKLLESLFLLAPSFLGSDAPHEFRRRFEALKLNTTTCCEMVHRFAEGTFQKQLNELENISTLTATMTMKDSLCRTHIEGGRALFVQWTLTSELRA